MKIAQTAGQRGFQFSLKDLLFATTCVAAGLAGLTALLRFEWAIESIPLFFGIWYASTALVGVGLLAPFQRKTIGAIAGYLCGWPSILFLQYLHQ